MYSCLRASLARYETPARLVGRPLRIYRIVPPAATDLPRYATAI